MRIAIYTAIIGDYEAPRDPIFMDEGIDYILFTDKRTESSKWKVRYVAHSGLTCRKSARAIKIRSHEYLPEYDLTIWVDANFCQKISLRPLIEKIKKNVTLLKHPKKNCIYEEAKACIELKLDYSDIINRQVEHYISEGYPSKNGLCATGFIIRKNTPHVAQMNEDWWYEVLGKSGRDQLSFNYVAWVNEVDFDTIPFYEAHSYFSHVNHKKERLKYELEND